MGFHQGVPPGDTHTFVTNTFKFGVTAGIIYIFMRTCII